MVLDAERIGHSLKIALACLLGYAITELLHLPVDQWLIITILVVMCAQLNVGSILQKSYMRFLGTLSGSLLGSATLIMFGNNQMVSASVIVLAAMFFSYIATSEKSYSESGTLGAVTVVIILAGQNPTITNALHRTLEISIGIIIAALVSKFVIPVHARTHLRRSQAETFKQLSHYYAATLINNTLKEPIDANQLIDEAIAKSMIAQRKLAREAARESFDSSFTVDYFNQSLWHEKEILRCIAFMRYIFMLSTEAKKSFFNIVPLQQFNQSICDTLNAISKRIYSKKSEKIMIPSVQPLKESILAETRHFSEEDKLHVNIFLFCAELLVKRLKEYEH